MNDSKTTSPDEFERPARFAKYHQGQFSLGMVRVNDPRQRNEILSRIRDTLTGDGIKFVPLDLSNRHPDSLRQALQHNAEGRTLLQKPMRAALAVTGMEHLLEATVVPGGRPPFAAALNAERDLLRSILPIPVLLFMTDMAMDRLDISAPDFFDWYSSTFQFQATGLVATRPKTPPTMVYLKPA